MGFVGIMDQFGMPAQRRERSDQSFPIGIDSYKEKNKKLPNVNLSKKHIHYPIMDNIHLDNDLF